MQPAAGLVAGEGGVDVLVAVGGEGVPVGGVGLPLIAGQGDGVELVGEQREQSGGVDRGQLFGVTDEDELALGCLGVGKESGKVAGAEHAGFVDDEHRPPGQPGWLPGAPGRSGRGRAAAGRRSQDGDAGAGLEFGGGAGFHAGTRGRGTGLVARPRVRDGEAAGLAGAGDADDDVDRVAGAAQLVDHPLLFAAERAVVLQGDVAMSAGMDSAASGRAAVDCAACRMRCSSCEQFPGGEHGPFIEPGQLHAAAAVGQADDLGVLRGSVRSSSWIAAAGAPAGSRSQMARTTSRRRNVLACAVNPSGPSSSRCQPLTRSARRGVAQLGNGAGQGLGNVALLGNDALRTRRRSRSAACGPQLVEQLLGTEAELVALRCCHRSCSRRDPRRRVWRGGWSGWRPGGGLARAMPAVFEGVFDVDAAAAERAQHRLGDPGDLDTDRAAGVAS